MSAEPAGSGRIDDVTASVAARVQSVLSAAEREASDLRREVEASTERRATAILMEAERDAEQLITQAADAARAYLDDARERIDAYVAERVGRVHAVTDRLLAAAEEVSLRLDETGEARRALSELVSTLGAAAAEAAREGARPVPPPPPAPDAPRAGGAAG